MHRRQFLAAIPSVASLKAQQKSGELTLWYKSPSKLWTDALPVGNGRLGAMVFGGIRSERLQLNEDTLWSGFPKDCNNPDARNHLAEVRRLVLEQEDYVGAEKLCTKMQGPYNQSYQPLADLRLTFELSEQVSNYRRDLNLDTAIASVSFDGHTRETFVSAPDQAIVTRIAGGQPLHFTIALDSPVRSTAAAESSSTLVLRGKAPSHVDPNYYRTPDPVLYDDAEGKGMRFEVRLRVLLEGGSAREDGNRLRIEGARSATILLTAATGFRGFNQPPDLTADAISAVCRKQLEAAARRTYPELKSRHIADHQKLFHRVSLDLGPNHHPDIPTDERLKSYKNEPDPQLLALYFQYGRYLLIASSRPGTQPANLQGIWNELVRPPWSSNWTTNINAQMNYWHAETCNLAECHEPLLQLIGELAQNGRKTAEVNYGIKGWMAHHNTDIWRQSAPVGDFGKGSPTWANWNMSAPWFCSHLWEHYLFSGDTEFLKQRAYPIMKGAAEACLGLLISDTQGRLTTCPSFSTENVFLTADGKTSGTSAGCTMDLALIREIFATTIEAAKILAVDAAFSKTLTDATAKLVPYQTGGRGQLQEWFKDFKEREPGHRHMSHMYPLYPGAEFTVRGTPKWAQACRRSLELRLEAGGAYTGWSRAWSIAFWARLEDGEKAHEGLGKLLELSTGPNLFDTHPAGQGWIFQIDGNFGAAAAIAEMLVQSHAGEIAILPALPSAWAEGAVKGLRARKNVEVDIAWRQGRATEAEVRPRLSGELRLRPPKGQTIAGVRQNADGTATLKVAAGKTYHLKFS